MAEPTADRPHVPGYGIPGSNDGILRWAWARERLAQGGRWELRPVRAFAWSAFPEDATRFRFDTG